MEMAFGESTYGGSLRWWQSWRCAQCRGGAIEADGCGPLPPELAALERARGGTWALVVDACAGPAAWKALREALGLEIADGVALKARLPGVVFEGTACHVGWLCDRVRAGGGVARVVRVA